MPLPSASSNNNLSSSDTSHFPLPTTEGSSTSLVNGSESAFDTTQSGGVMALQTGGAPKHLPLKSSPRNLNGMYFHYPLLLSVVSALTMMTMMLMVMSILTSTLCSLLLSIHILLTFHLPSPSFLISLYPYYHHHLQAQLVLISMMAWVPAWGSFVGQEVPIGRYNKPDYGDTQRK